MEPHPLLGLPKANPTSVDLETLLKSIDRVHEKLNYEMSVGRVLGHKLMKAEEELVDLNEKKADTFGEKITFLNFELFQKHRGHIESYEHSWKERPIEEEHN
ncbi:hypothetical protein DVH24_039154 [Malus domestica]|uniref:Uncharacterized protein n=1 Tax=Malus domestica TaxID=3750 RepID=A0A498K9B2_MALDO|nr:hypothetical protein DVH24_039154 [Malus domestica]